ncbi:ABC transporter permease subunit [Nocardioides perillae]|uniref:Simple sugar transport system permease protein n=1 Tax=Nocardioides perillae TaxID=1119534 RepID=A0A7Y9US19_9ACTN|nr:simple sugar transport system permease protein [Nocardioides perillae]
MSAPAPSPTDPTPPRPQQPVRDDQRWRRALREAAAGGVVVSFFALLLAVLVGSVLIAVTDEEVQSSAGYFFSRPGDTVRAVLDAVTGAYGALFRGSVYNPNGADLATQLRPLTQTFLFAGPLVLAGLGVGLAFRAALFNIGGRGQMLLGGAAAGWVGSSLDLPGGVHLLVGLLAAVVAGGLWGAIAGVLKARTGAHEVIVTIMLNYIGFYLVFYALSQPSLLQAPGTTNLTTLPMKDTATLPPLLGERFDLHAGFLLALVATAAVWWLLERSALGFRIRAVGLNPDAARVAGIDVGRTWTVVMALSGALVGLAAANQALGTVTSGVTVDIDAGIGFDAITVALLGRSRPLGILAAGLLFGAFKAGGFLMQASEGIPVDLVLVVQSLIVLFIAAPPLVRALFRLPQKEVA